MLVAGCNDVRPCKRRIATDARIHCGQEEGRLVHPGDDMRREPAVEGARRHAFSGYW